jgi:hypothetical protein
LLLIQNKIYLYGRVDIACSKRWIVFLFTNHFGNVEHMRSFPAPTMPTGMHS